MCRPLELKKKKKKKGGGLPASRSYRRREAGGWGLAQIQCLGAARSRHSVSDLWTLNLVRVMEFRKREGPKEKASCLKFCYSTGPVLFEEFFGPILL